MCTFSLYSVSLKGIFDGPQEEDLFINNTKREANENQPGDESHHSFAFHKTLSEHNLQL